MIDLRMNREFLATQRRILTTHVGSLPRPTELRNMLARHMAATERMDDSTSTDALIRASVIDVVRMQCSLGVDIVSDGEMGKTGFSRYVTDRLSGFGEGDDARFMVDDLAEIEDSDLNAVGTGAGGVGGAQTLQCVGPIAVVNEHPLLRDLRNLQDALADNACLGAFVPSVTPGTIAFNFPNRHYASYEEYLEALANVMRQEYETIIAAGFLLQLDSPDLAFAARARVSGAAVPDFKTHLHLAVDALNHAISRIPADKIRLHVCWGNYAGPHHHDVELREILPSIFKAKVGAVAIESANPRHEHEWEVFRAIEPPQDVVLIPGVIDNKHSIVEHPDLVMQRIERFAHVLGRDRIIAGVDCGFATTVGRQYLPAKLVWLKLAALVEGAKRASARIYQDAHPAGC